MFYSADFNGKLKLTPKQAAVYPRGQPEQRFGPLLSALLSYTETTRNSATPTTRRASLALARMSGERRSGAEAVENGGQVF